VSRRYQLTDAQWGLIEPQFPSRSLIGRPTREPRQVLDGILWILHTGAPWRDLPERFGPWNSVYNTFRRWQDAGRIDAILEALQLKLNEEGLIDFDLWCLDGSNVRASKDAAGARKKTLNESSPWPFAGFRQQNSLGHGRSWLTTELLPVTGAISRNQLCNKRVGHGEDTNVIRSLPNTASASCRRQGL
jgi:transposase